MSSFEVKVYKIKIEPHPNADQIELARIGDYLSIVGKGEYVDGDLCVYIPEASLVPELVLKHIGLWDNENNKGKLAGSLGNRVKAKKLRGIVSQGLIYPVEAVIPNKGISNGMVYFDHLGNPHHQVIHEEQDVADILGITKYEPPIPISLRGEVWAAFGHCVNYDIENVKRYNSILKEGEEVVFTEKLHGTFCAFGFNTEGEKIIHSKGLGSQGFAFKTTEENKDNVYVKTTLPFLEVNYYNTEFPDGILLMGEIFGPIQDLSYGFKTPEFRLFDVYVGKPSQGRYLNFWEKREFAERWDIKMVPVLYVGPYNREVMVQYTNGMETLSGKALHIREGLVITPIEERQDMLIGRVILKSVSDDYLLRKNKNATEFT